MANTKHRRQFNCYIKDAYVDRLRTEAQTQGIPAGELVEAMLDVFQLQDLGPLLVRLSDRIANGVDTQQLEQLQTLLKVALEG